MVKHQKERIVGGASTHRHMSSFSWTRDHIKEPYLDRKRTGLFLNCLKFPWCIQVNVVFHLKIKEEEFGGSESTLFESFQSVLVRAPCHLMVGQLSFLNHCSQFLEILEHSMLPSADELFDFIFQRVRASRRYQKGFNTSDGSVPDWPTDSPDRKSMSCCQEEADKHQTQQQGSYWRIKGFPLRHSYRPMMHWGSHSCKKRTNQELSKRNMHNVTKPDACAEIHPLFMGYLNFGRF